MYACLVSVPTLRGLGAQAADGLGQSGKKPRPQSNAVGASIILMKK